MDIEVYRRGSPGTIRPRAASFFDDYISHVSHGLSIDGVGLSELVSLRQGHAVPQTRERAATQHELDAALAAFGSSECDGVLAHMIGTRSGERWMFEPGVEFSALGPDAMGKVEATIYLHPDNAESVDSAGAWAEQELRSLIDRFQPAYGRIATAAAASWWEGRRSRDRSHHAWFHEAAESRIKSPDWMIYLTEGHLDALDLDGVADVAASIEPYADGALVKWTTRFSTMTEDGLDTWLATLDPILW